MRIVSIARTWAWTLSGRYWLVAIVLILSDVPANGQEKRLFPDTLSQEVEAKVGRRVTLIPDGADGLHYFPDGPLSFLSSRPIRFLMPAANGTAYMAGEDFGSVTLRSQIMSPSGSGPDANYAGVYSIWRRSPKDQYVAIYHAENHEGMGRMEGNDINGAYWSVCLAMIDPSNDHVERRGEILRADTPKRRLPVSRTRSPPYVSRDSANPASHLTETRGTCSAITLRRPTGWIAVSASAWLAARSRRVEAPGSWTKYFQGRWDEPGLGGHETPVLSAEGGDVGQSSVTYVKPWKRYVIVFCHQGFEDFQAGRAKQSGVYLATSGDGVRWTAPQRIMTTMTVPKTGKPFVQHPTLVVTTATKTGLQGHLYYAFSPRWPTPHHLAASQITIRFRGQ